MDVNCLKSFLAVADTGSFTKAAEGLFTTQPTLSRHIASLEAELGVRLMERNRHAVHLTAAGKLLFHEGKRWIAQMISIERRVSTADAGGARKLDIICSPMYSQILRNVYQRFRETYPDVICNIRQVESGKELDAVRTRDTDIGILFYRLEVAENAMYQSFCIAEEPLRLVSGAGAGIARKGPLSLADFKDETLIIAQGHQMDDWIDGIHRSVAPYFKRVVRTENIESVALNTSINQGVAIWPEVVVKDTQSYNQILDVPEFREKTELLAVWMKDNHNAYIHKFIDLCSKTRLGGICGHY